MNEVRRTESIGKHPSLFAGVMLGKLHEPHEMLADVEPITAPELLKDIAEARQFPGGFFAFARHWHFRNRETGGQLTFRNLWEGQRKLAQLMIDVAVDAEGKDWQGIFALKAGKLGFTELECCWDGYVLWSRRNGRVHLFSKEEDAAKEMLGYVRYGLAHLESAWGLRFLDSSLRQVEAEKAGSRQFKCTVVTPAGDQDYGDVRTLVAFATGKFPAIDQSCQHAHVDEWAHMEDPGAAWGSIGTTIAPGGTGHIVTRGAGENKTVEDTWQAAVEKQSKLRAFFAPWRDRADRDEGWFQEQAATLPTLAALSHFAAETPDDAFRGDEDNDFVPIEIWDRRAELVCCSQGHVKTPKAVGVDEVPEVDRWQPETCPDCRTADSTGRFQSYLRTHPLQPGPDQPTIILGADAGVTRDNFGVVGVTRHPLRPDDPAIRVRRLWTPDDFEDGIIDFATVESWLRQICEGGCVLGHPQYAPWKGGGMCKRRKGQTWEPGECPACAAGEISPPYNVYQIAFDPYQLEAMMQGLKRDGVTWIKPFSQGAERMEADRTFFDVIVGGRLGHTGDEMLRLHVGNAKSKTQKDEDSKLRIVKKAPHRQIDLAVAASMAIAECLRLNL